MAFLEGGSENLREFNLDSNRGFQPVPGSENKKEKCLSPSSPFRGGREGFPQLSSHLRGGKRWSFHHS